MDGSEMRDWDLNRDFADILLPRRGTSDVMWASRKWKPAIAHEQLVQLGGDEIKSIVFNSPHLKHIINKVK